MQTSYERKNAKGQREFGNDALNHKILYILMTEYLILLIWVIALKCNAPWLQELGEEMRSLPFNSRVGRLIIPFYKMIDKGIYFDLDYFMNVLIYIPLGIFLSFITKKKIFLNLAIIFISSAIFEAVQYVTGFGGCEQFSGRHTRHTVIQVASLTYIKHKHQSHCTRHVHNFFADRSLRRHQHGDTLATLRLLTYNTFS